MESPISASDVSAMKITGQGCVNGLGMLWWGFTEKVDQSSSRCNKTGMDPFDAFVPRLEAKLVDVSIS